MDYPLPRALICRSIISILRALFRFFVGRGAGTLLSGTRSRGSSLSLLFDIVDLEGIRGRRAWLFAPGRVWCFGIRTFWSTAYFEICSCCRLGFWLWGFALGLWARSEEHTSELQSIMRSSYAVLCLK